MVSDIGNELTNSIPRDGTAPPTANIPMGNYKLTGIGAATLATDAPQYQQIQSGASQYLTAIAGTNTITATAASPTLTAYAAGNTFRFVAAGANTGSVTININGLGAKDLTKNGTTALASGDIPSGAAIQIFYDGTRFQVQGVPTLPDGSITPAKLSTGGPSWDTSSRFSVTGAVGIGVTASDTAKLAVQGVGQASNTYTDAGNGGATLRVVDSATAINAGGVILVGGKSASVFAGLKGQLTDGSNNTVGSLGVLVRRATTDAALTEVARYSVDGSQSSVIPGGSTLYPEFKCRAWVNFNGTGTVAIRGSGNVTSITDNAVGDYTINFTTALPDANYSFVAASQRNAATSLSCVSVSDATAPTASALRVLNTTQAAATSTGADSAYVCVSIFR